MEKKFIFPASTMLIGIISWVILLFTVNTDPTILWQELLIGVLIGALLVISAITCKSANGPREGNIFRSILLTLMAIVTYWLVGIVSGSLLLFSAILVGLIAINTKKIEPISSAVDNS